MTCYTFAFKEHSLGNLSQEPGGPRSPAVFGSIISYVEQFFETVGISLAERQVHPFQSSVVGYLQANPIRTIFPL